MAARQVRALLMGGQACVFSGAAEFSRDTDLLILRTIQDRALLALAVPGKLDVLDAALAKEERGERERDRLHWAPLKAELERLRHTAMKRPLT